MATVMQNEHLPMPSGQSEPSGDPCNEIIEEKRKDAEGRIIVNKYIKGKLLGKVCNKSQPYSTTWFELTEHSISQ